MISSNAMLIEQAKGVMVLAPVAPSTTTPDYVSMKNCNRLCLLINVLNGTTVTGSAISLTQATDVSNTAGKTLAFTKAFAALNTGAGGNTDVLTEFAVSSNTFTTNTTNALHHLYAIEVNESDLDVANGFDCVRVNTGNSVNATLSIVGILYPARYGKTSLPSSVAD
jgi:hypothetical protein